MIKIKEKREGIFVDENVEQILFNYIEDIVSQIRIEGTNEEYCRLEVDNKIKAVNQVYKQLSLIEDKNYLRSRGLYIYKRNNYSIISNKSILIIPKRKEDLLTEKNHLFKTKVLLVN